MNGKLSPKNISTKQNRIATLASTDPERALTTLAHHIDLDWLYEAYRRTRKSAAPGIDGVTAKQYAENLEANLSSLLDRFKSGRYRAPAVRRVHIEKDEGQSTRPLGIPTLEDKILQRAVMMVLEPIYEQDFLDCSHGFRPGRSAHDALSELWRGLMGLQGCWVLDLDISKFFDNVDKAEIGKMLDQRVRDGVIRRVIGKWLKAGVMENGVIHRPDRGTPQGGVISPLLANLYLHEVLDVWFERDVKPRLHNCAFMVRYADDAVLCFKSEKDARRVLAVLVKRLGRYGLSLNTTKTKLIRFVPKSPGSNDVGDSNGNTVLPVRSFDFLGFSHTWQRSRKGRWVVVRRTAKARFARALRSMWLWCRRNRHRPLAEQQYLISRKLVGHYNYYGIIGNSLSLRRFLHKVQRVWCFWLRKRSSKKLTWVRLRRLLDRYPLAPAVLPRGRSSM